MGGIQLDEESIFDVAIQIESKQGREDYLLHVCGNDLALMERVRALLEIHEEDKSFLANPPVEMPETLESSKVTEQPGDSIGPYKLLQKIGEGGFGVVYMAGQSRPVRRKIALKVIKPGMDTREVIARFEAERQALALMDHPSIAKVFDGGSTDSGRPYFVMELVKGGSS
jgi:serine/threonine protein kinase